MNDEKDFLANPRPYKPGEKGGAYVTESPIPFDINPPKGPGVLESAAISFSLESSFFTAPKALYRAGERIFNSVDGTPEGWEPWHEDNSSIPTENLPYIYSSVSKSDREARIKYVMEENTTRQYLASGSTIGSVGGSLIGALVSWENLFPIAAGLKMESIGKTLLSQSAQHAPNVLTTLAIHNAFKEGSKTDGDIQSWAFNTAVEAMFAIPTVGAIGAYSQWKRVAGENMLKARFEGVEILSEAHMEGPLKGQFKSYKALEPQGASGGSMFIGEGSAYEAAKKAQEFIDYGLAKYGESTIFKRIFQHSPVVRGLTSPFLATRRFVGEMFDHNMVTGAHVNATPVGAPAERIWRNITANALKTSSDIKADYWDYIGVFGPMKDLQGSLSSKISPVPYLENVGRAATFEGKAEWIADDVLRGTVEKSAQRLRKNYDSLYENELVAKNLLPEGLSPMGAMSYINRVYNVEKMKADPEGFMAGIMEGLADQNNRLKGMWEPLHTIDAQIKQIRGIPFQTGIPKNKQIREKNLKIKALKEQRAAEKAKTQKRIDEGEFANQLELLTAKPMYSSEEREFFKETKAPFESLESEIKSLKERRLKSKDKVERKELRALRKEKESELSKMYSNLESEFKVTNDPEGNSFMSFRGREADKFFNTKKVKFKDIEAAPFIRKMTSESEFKNIALRLYNRITEETAEQQVARMGQVLGSGGGMGNPLKARTNTIGEKFMEPYLERNAITLLERHADFVGKHAGMEEVAQRMGTTSKDMMQKIFQEMKDEYDVMKVGKNSKELLALSKEYEKEVDYIKTANAIYFGTFQPGKLGGKTGQAISSALRALKNFAAGTMLGNLPFLQGPEFFVNAMHHGVGPTLEHGLLPMLTKMSRTLSRQEAADAAVALNQFSNQLFDQMYGAGSEFINRNLADRITSNIAKFGMNASGSNWISDQMETMAATLSSNHSYRSLRKFVEGKAISKKDMERLGQLGLSDRNLADRIIQQFDSHADFVGEAGAPKSVVSNFSEWNDYGAAKAMQMSIQREIRGTILKPNMLDIPFTMRNEFISAMGQFMSYSFAATNSFLIPTLQSPDAQKIIGMMMMIGIGAMTPVMRQISRNEKPNLEMDHLLMEGVINSGVLGVHMDVVRKIGGVFDLPIAGDRMRGKGAFASLGGPLGGVLDSAAQVVDMGIRGEINEGGIRKARNLMPSVFHNWYTTWLTNSMIEGLELPKTRGDATNWFGNKREAPDRKPSPEKLFGD